MQSRTTTFSAARPATSLTCSFLPPRTGAAPLGRPRARIGFGSLSRKLGPATLGIFLAALGLSPHRACADAGLLDPSFTPGRVNLGSAISQVALQSDGKILVLGSLTNLNDVVVSNNLARLRPDGTRDLSFDIGVGFVGTLTVIPGVFTNQSPPLLNALAVQTDDAILVGGDFRSVAGLARTNLARFSANGTLDASFDPAPEGAVSAIRPQPAGKTLIGGAFARIKGTPRKSVALLRADGTVDPSFNPNWGSLIPGTVRALAVQADGKIVVAGGILKLVGSTPTSLAAARLNADGSLDAAFTNLALPFTVDSTIAVALQTDGRILVGGFFPSIGGAPRANITRLNADGTLDGAWTGAGAEGSAGNVQAIRLQSDGKAIVVGGFSTYNGIPRAGVARLGLDGSLDTTFANPSITAPFGLTALELQPDGKVLIAGGFAMGTSPLGLLRLAGDASSSPTAPVITTQPVAQAVNAGGQVSFTVAATSATPVGFQWRFNGKDITGATNSTLTIPSVTQPDGGVYTVLVSNSSGAVSSAGALLNPVAPGWPDLSFANTGTDPLRVNALFRASDGAILMAGAFTKVNGYTRNLVARLKADGSVDTGFQPSSTATVEIFGVATQSSGKPVVVGNLSWPNDGVAYTGVGRLNLDGSLDKTFNPGSGPDDTPFAVAVQSDDKVLIGGFFGHVNGVVRPGIARLNANGDLDAGFAPAVTLVGVISAIAVQPGDGKIVIGGLTAGAGTVPSRHVLRLEVDGRLDPGFDPGTGPNAQVRSLVVEADGKIVMGGEFTAVNGVSRNGVARLNRDGTLDLAFDTSASPFGHAFVWAVAAQPDGKVIVGGAFETFGAVPRKKIVRLNPDGSVDAGFAPADGANNAEIKALALLPDGKIMAGGDFTSYDGFPFNRLVRLHGGGGDAAGARLQAVLSGNVLTLTWPDPAFGLQTAPDLASRVWADLPGSSPQKITLRASQGFYRLRKL